MSAAAIARSLVPPWALVWLLALAVFAAFKCLTWRRALGRGGRRS